MEESIIKKEDKLQFAPGLLARFTGTLTLTPSNLSFADKRKTFFAIPVKDIVSVNTKKSLGGKDCLVVFYIKEGKEQKVTIEHYRWAVGVTLGALAQLGPSYFASWEATINNVRFGNNHSNPVSELDELEKLARLKEKGFITEAEFTAKKKQILGL